MVSSCESPSPMTARSSFPNPPRSGNLDPRSARVVRANAFVTTFFETTHPKYHWLTEQACIAFGTWELGAGIVNASFDVYCAE